MKWIWIYVISLKTIFHCNEFVELYSLVLFYFSTKSSSLENMYFECISICIASVLVEKSVTLTWNVDAASSLNFIWKILYLDRVALVVSQNFFAFQHFLLSLEILAKKYIGEWMGENLLPFPIQHKIYLEFLKKKI